MELSATYTSRISVVETLTGPFVSPLDATFTTDQLGTTETLTSSTTVPVTKQSSGLITMSSGTGSINLAALAGATLEEVVVGTGLKVQYMKFRGKSTNANPITVAKGASNGYGLGAAGATWSATMDANQEVTFRGNDANPDVAAGARIFDVTGTGSQVLEYHIVLG